MHLEGFCDLSLFVEIDNMLNDTSKSIALVEIHGCSRTRHASFHSPSCLFNDLLWARLSGSTKFRRWLTAVR